MKLLFLFLLFGNTTPETRVDRFPQSNSTYSGCDSRETAAGILASSRLPREVIFHYGKKELLMKDVKEGNIPENDWNDYIMGDKTRFKLKRFRRGFYGTEYAEDADRFGDSAYNWLVEIKLKAECLVSDRVTSLVYLSKNPDFKKWYELKTRSLTFTKWVSSCFDTEGYPRYEAFVNYKNPSETADFKESECEKVLADYYEEKKFALVHDYAGDLVRSWAIRDRNCISEIKGSDTYWVKAFALRSEFWENSCNRERNHRNNIRVWFSAISNVGISLQQLEKFTAVIKELKVPENRLDWETQEEDRFVVQDFSHSLLMSLKRCGASGLNSFKERLASISMDVDQLQSIDVKAKLESLCR